MSRPTQTGALGIAAPGCAWCWGSKACPCAVQAGRLLHHMRRWLPALQILADLASVKGIQEWAIFKELKL
jgi:hypothetical protein